MLAEIPLELRSRLGLALFALGRLAEEVGVQPSPAATVNSLVAGLKDPFLFVVAGEVNAGKSMLLNGLFGEEFCPTSALPSTDKIRYFRHGFTRQEIAFSPEIQEVRVPLPFLQDFHIVDTPGVNSVAVGHEAITEQFLPRADAVLFVLPVTNPWGARCWEFLARIHHQLGKRIVLVLSQIDVRSEMEVAAIVEHLQLCLKQYLGRELPVFPVSARQALLARTSAVDKQELLSQSRFQPLEAYLNQILTETDARRERLANTLRMGQILLSHIQSRLVEKATRLTALGDALRKIGQAVQIQKTQTWETCLQTLPEVAQSMRAAAPEQWGEATRLTLAGQCETVRQAVEKDLQHLWRQTRVNMDVALSRRVSEPTTMRPEIASLRAAHEEILAPWRDGAAWSETIVPLQQAAKRAQRRSWLGAIGGGIAFGIGLWLQHYWLVIVGGSVCGIALAWGWWQRRVAGRKLIAHQQRLATEETLRVMTAAEAALQDWLQRAFQAFSTHYKPLLETCEQTRTQQEARHQEVTDMQQNLASLSKQLLGS